MILLLGLIALSCLFITILMLHYGIEYHRLVGNIGMLLTLVVILLTIIEGIK